MPQVWTVTTEFASRGDAVAMKELIEELGYRATVQYRTIDEGPQTPIRETRLGRRVLRAMEPDKTYTIEDIAIVVEEAEYAPSSAAAALSVLTAQGDLERIDRGLYRLARRKS